VAVPVPTDYRGSPASLPDREGYVERDGVRTFYEVYGDGATTILFLPTWSIVHSRVWRCQIPYFARHYRVIAFDGRGNGRSDRPGEPPAYHPKEFVRDALAVLDATETERAITVSLSASTTWNLMLAALQTERVEAAAFVGPTTYAVSEPFPEWSLTPFNERFESYAGFPGQNRYFIRDHYREFVEFWTRLCFPEPHSTRPIEYGVGMSLETNGDVVLATLDAAGMRDNRWSAERLAEAGAALRPLARGLTCPVLVIEGELDPIALPHWARALADDTGGRLVTIPEAGHVPCGRKPVIFNLVLQEFVESVRAGEARAPLRTEPAAA
jgi:pimeloyl-ACP methyl ester carboxylesterase